MKFDEIVDDAFAEGASNYSLTGYNLDHVIEQMANDAMKKYQSQLHEAFKTEFWRLFEDYFEMMKGLHVKSN